MSHLLILGGTGRTGIHILNQAAERGHHVRALVRNPDAVQTPAGVELIQGTPSNIDDIRKAAVGTEAVISALNNSRASDSGVQGQERRFRRGAAHGAGVRRRRQLGRARTIAPGTPLTSIDRASPACLPRLLRFSRAGLASR